MLVDFFMKIIKHLEGVLLLCMTLVLSGCYFHRPAYYPAQVLMKNGRPCFSVENNRENRMIHPVIELVGVSSHADNGPNPIWSQEFFSNEPPMKLSPHECIAYDEGGSLQYGFRYSVVIMTVINEVSKVYRAYFCLSETAEGNAEIHHIKEQDWRICGEG